MVEVVTWQEAEDALLAAVEYLGALPDRERGFLSAGSRSLWPSMVKDVQADYADADARPRRQLGRKEMALLDEMLLAEGAAALAVPEAHRRLVGRVLVAKLDGRGEGFTWSRIWMAEGGRGCGVTSDALRRRYERGVHRVAMAMEVRRQGLARCGRVNGVSGVHRQK